MCAWSEMSREIRDETHFQEARGTKVRTASGRKTHKEETDSRLKVTVRWVMNSCRIWHVSPLLLLWGCLEDDIKSMPNKIATVERIPSVLHSLEEEKLNRKHLKVFSNFSQQFLIIFFLKFFISALDIHTKDSCRNKKNHFSWLKILFRFRFLLVSSFSIRQGFLPITVRRHGAACWMPNPFLT